MVDHANHRDFFVEVRAGIAIDFGHRSPLRATGEQQRNAGDGGKQQNFMQSVHMSSQARSGAFVAGRVWRIRNLRARLRVKPKQ